MGRPLAWTSVNLSWPGQEFQGDDGFTREKERGHWTDWTDEAGRARFSRLPSQTVLGGRFALRVAITNHRTRPADLERLVAAVLELGDELARETPATTPISTARS